MTAPGDRLAKLDANRNGFVTKTGAHHTAVDERGGSRDGRWSLAELHAGTSRFARLDTDSNGLGVRA